MNKKRSKVTQAERRSEMTSTQRHYWECVSCAIMKEFVRDMLAKGSLEAPMHSVHAARDWADAAVVEHKIKFGDET